MRLDGRRLGQVALLPPPVNRRKQFTFGMALAWWSALAGVSSPLVHASAWTVHGVWCLGSLFLILGWATGRVRAGVVNVISDHLLVLACAFTLYFVGGAALLVVGPQWQVARSLAFYPVDAAGALRVDAVNGVGLGIAFMVASRTKPRLGPAVAGQLSAAARMIPAWFGLLSLLLIGAVASVVTAAYDLGLADGTLPGIVRALTRFSGVALFLCAAYTGRGSIGLLAIATAVTIGLSGLGFVQFSKSSTLLPLAIYTIGIAIRSGRYSVLVVGGTVVLSLYWLLSGAAAFGRGQIPIGETAPLTERLAVAARGLSLSASGSSRARGGPWSRLNYVPAQAAAMDLYDVGRGGDDISRAPWVFVPRVLYSNKPIMTEAGVDLNEKIRGSRTSATGVGVFVDGYYNSGWIGLLLGSAFVGWLLAQTSAVARATLTEGGILALPLAFLGAFIAFRIDGRLLSDYLGMSIYLLYALLLGALGLQVLRSAIPAIRTPASPMS